MIERLLDLGADTSVIDPEGQDASMHVQEKMESSMNIFRYKRISREYDNKILELLIL